MPIHLRNAKNNVDYPVPGELGVEIRDDHGRLAVAIIQLAGTVKILTPGSKEFADYCRITKSTASRVVVHEDYSSSPKH